MSRNPSIADPPKAGRVSIASWIFSLLVGTYAGAYGYVTAISLFSGSWLKWLLMMAIASGLAAVQVAIVGGIDVFLLSVRVRMLPQGRNAWLSSVGAAVLTGIAAKSWPFARFGSPVAFVASLLVPMIVFGLLTRLYWGERCD